MEAASAQLAGRRARGLECLDQGGSLLWTIAARAWDTVSLWIQLEQLSRESQHEAARTHNSNFSAIW